MSSWSDSAVQESFGISSYSKRSWDFQALGIFFSFLDIFGIFLGIPKIPGNSRDWDPTLFGKNPMGFKIPGIGIFFVGLGIPTKKPPLDSNVP